MRTNETTQCVHVAPRAENTVHHVYMYVHTCHIGPRAQEPKDSHSALSSLQALLSLFFCSAGDGTWGLCV